MNNWQQNPQWANISLGFSYLSIRLYGCVISCIGNALDTTPDVVNDSLKAVQGFKGALVDWTKIAQAFPGITATVYNTYDNQKILQELARGNRILVFVSAAPIGGTGEHCIEFIGNGQCKDPWTGRVRPTSDFPDVLGEWVSISGNWQATANPVPSTQGGGSVDQNTINGQKAVEFDRIVNFLNSVGLLTTNKSEDYPNDKLLETIQALKQDRDFQSIRAGWYDKVCIALNLQGDTSKIDYTQVLNKIEDPEAVQKYSEIEAIVNK